jgi:hypothetical protein
MSNIEVYGDTNQVVVDEATNTLEVTTYDTTVEVSSVGVQGARGTLFLSGNGLPTSDIGVDGDFYIDLSDSSAVYGPKIDGAWPPLAIGRFSQFTQRSIFTQGSASDTWSINHTLGGYPSVTVVNSTGTVVVGTVTYISTSEIQIEFTAPFSGTAYLT